MFISNIDLGTYCFCYIIQRYIHGKIPVVFRAKNKAYNICNFYIFFEPPKAKIKTKKTTRTGVDRVGTFLVCVLVYIAMDAINDRRRCLKEEFKNAWPFLSVSHPAAETCTSSHGSRKMTLKFL